MQNKKPEPLTNGKFQYSQWPKAEEMAPKFHQSLIHSFRVVRLTFVCHCQISKYHEAYLRNLLTRLPESYILPAVIQSQYRKENQAEILIFQLAEK